MIVVNATFQIADAILILAALSYLGLGLPPPAATWGGILSNGLNYLYDGYWWQVYPVGRSSSSSPSSPSTSSATRSATPSTSACSEF